MAQGRQGRTGTAAITADATRILARSREVIEPALRAAVARLDRAGRRVVEYHLGFRDADGRPAAGDAAGGKQVRGALALLSARAAGAPDEVGLPGAVAVELTHNHSLLHDDIIDRDEMRRHRPTAWTVFGSEVAILAGDAAAALASEMLAEADAPPAAVVRAVRMLSAATRRMILGQTDDIAFEDNADVDLAACRQMVDNKTGALLSCAASIGAALAGATPDVVYGLEGFGRHLGMAFQLVDDILGIWGTTEATGKPQASDLASRKMSLPVVAALAAGGADADRLRAIYAQPGRLSARDLVAAAAAVAGAGGRAWAETEADRETAEALRALDEAAIDEAARGDLRALTVMLCHRDH